MSPHKYFIIDNNVEGGFKEKIRKTKEAVFDVLGTKTATEFNKKYLLAKSEKTGLPLPSKNTMTGKLSSEQAEELKRAFEVMDINKDGVVTKEELTTLLKSLREDVTEEVVDEMIKITDENGDG
jgi:hypothetical protein